MKKKKLMSIAFSMFSLLLYSQDTIHITLDEAFIEDATINSELDYTNGNNSSLVASYWTYLGNNGWGRALLEFDLSAIPVFAEITSAKLSLFHDSISIQTGHSNIGGDNSGLILRVIEDWTDNEVDWSSQPRTSNVHSVIVPAPDSNNQNYLDISISEIVQNFVDHPENANGILLKLYDENQSQLFRSLVFASVDNTINGLKPRLHISYLTNRISDTVLVKQPGPETGKDAYINMVYGEPNGSRVSLISSAWHYNQGEGVGRSYLEFNLTDIPVGMVLHKAELSLFHDPVAIHYGHSTNGGPNDMLIQKVVEPWEEHEIFWGDQPGVTEDQQTHVSFSQFYNQDYLNIDVTDIIKDQINGENYGMLVKLENESLEDINRSLVFASSDHDSAFLRPKLELYFIDITNIEEAGSKKFDFTLYPNPTKREVQVISNNTILEGGSYQITNLAGKIVLNGMLYSHKLTLDVSSLDAGIYIIQVGNMSEIETKKLIIL